MGIKGAMFQMIGHGISSAGMFFMVGVVYDRVHHRQSERVRWTVRSDAGLHRAVDRSFSLPRLGLPGLCGFIGEVFVVLSVWNFSTCPGGRFRIAS